jgi:hypothetical protein
LHLVTLPPFKFKLWHNVLVEYIFIYLLEIVFGIILIEIAFDYVTEKCILLFIKKEKEKCILPLNSSFLLKYYALIIF